MYELCSLLKAVKCPINSCSVVSNIYFPYTPLHIQHSYAPTTVTKRQSDMEPKILKSIEHLNCRTPLAISASYCKIKLLPSDRH